MGKMSKQSTPKSQDHRRGRSIPVHDAEALAAALRRLVTKFGSQAEASRQLGFDRTRINRMLRGGAQFVRDPVFMRLSRHLEPQEARTIFIRPTSTLVQYGQHLDRELKRYGLWLQGLDTVLSHPERFPALFIHRPKPGKPLGIARLQAILAGRMPRDVPPQTAVRSFEEAGFDLDAFNPVGEAIREAIATLDESRHYWNHLRKLRQTLQSRWGRYSPESVAEFFLVMARILAPLLPAAAQPLRDGVAEDGDDLRAVFVPDDSGTSRSLEELDAAGELGRYLKLAINAELIRLNRPAALLRPPLVR